MCLMVVAGESWGLLAGLTGREESVEAPEGWCVLVCLTAEASMAERQSEGMRLREKRSPVGSGPQAGNIY